MTITVLPGDCLDVLRTLADNSADACVTDPPYALLSMTKARPDLENANNPYARKQAARGFMGKQWDTGERAFSVEFWREVYRVLKPGGHVLAFGGTRTYHRLACAIEDAGFEVRDQIGWCFGSGFPKSHNQGNGWGTALKPAWEPICVARKPLSEGTVAANVLRWGTGAINVDGCRVPMSAEDAEIIANMGGFGRASYQREVGVALELSVNPMPCVDAKPNTKGRWPANLIHDGSDEVLAAFPDAPGQQRAVGPANGAMPSINVYGDYGPRDQFEPRADTGSAARFFFSAKADADDRLGSRHPTVKPVDLMQYLVRLVTPTGGLVLDPFAGTGTTGEAAAHEGMRAILIERDPDSLADIARRIELLRESSTTRRAASLKARGKIEGPGPLFEGLP